MNASHVIALYVRIDFDNAHGAALLAQEEINGRFPTGSSKDTPRNGRSVYISRHQNALKDVGRRPQKQAYLALGTLLLAATALGINTAPIESFDSTVTDVELDLSIKGLGTVVLLALGYRSGEDFNACLPKSRLPAEQLFTKIWGGIAHRAREDWAQA